MRTGVTVAMNLRQVRELWPHLADTADQVRVRSFLAVPLATGDQHVGALNLYSAEDTVSTAADQFSKSETMGTPAATDPPTEPALNLTRRPAA